MGENLDGIVIDEAKLNELKKSGTTNPEAYELVQRARVLEDVGSKVSTSKTIELYEEALKHDPLYADAYALLGTAHADSTGVSIALPINAFTKAKEAFEKCLEIDPEHPIALAGLGRLAINFEWDIKKAKALLDRAYKRNPNEQKVLRSYGNYYMAIGDSDSLAAFTLQGI